MVKLAPRFIVVVAAVVAFIYMWDTQMLAPVLPIYSKEIGASTLMVGVIMGVYSATNCIGNLVFGRMSDTKGRRLPLTIGFIGAAIFVFLYSWAAAPMNLLIVRLIHGFFAGALGPCTAAVITDLAPPERRGAYMGIWTMAVALGVAVTSPLAGTLSTTYGYLSVWLTISIIYLIAPLLIWTLLPETHRKQEIQFEAIANNAVAKPSVLSILKRRNVVIAYYGIFSMYWLLGTAVVLFDLYLADLQVAGVIGVDPKMGFGILMGVFGLASILLNYLCGRLSDVVGRKTPLMVAFLMLTGAPLLISNPSVPMIVVAWVVLWALATAAIWPSVLALLGDELALHERGIGFGFFMFFLTLGTGVGMPVMGYVGEVMGLATGIKVAALFPAIAFFLSLAIRPRPGAEAKFGTKSKLCMIIVVIVLLVASYPLITFLQP